MLKIDLVGNDVQVLEYQYLNTGGDGALFYDEYAEENKYSVATGITANETWDLNNYVHGYTTIRFFNTLEQAEEHYHQLKATEKVDNEKETHMEVY